MLDCRPDPIPATPYLFLLLMATSAPSSASARADAVRSAGGEGDLTESFFVTRMIRGNEVIDTQPGLSRSLSSRRLTL